MVKPTVVSTFAGCGGSSLGYKMAGFKELLATDFDEDAVATFKVNFPGVKMIQADIRTLTAPQVLEMAGLKKGELDVLDGSPPCQGFSHAGRRKVKDTRNDLFREYVRLIRGLEPKVFVMENVAGMASGRMKGRFIEIFTTLKSLGYRVQCRKMNAKNYGVPQSRERVIFIGVRKDLGRDPVFPKPERFIATVRSAFHGLPPQVEDRPMAEWLRVAAKEVRPGMNFKNVASIFIRHKNSPAGCIATKRLAWSRPAPTITSSEFGSGLIHPEEDRFLTLAELKRLATFPDEFWFSSRTAGCARIGNAVMPRFMYHIARAIREGVLSQEKAQVKAGKGPRTSQVKRPRGGRVIGKGAPEEAVL